MDEIMVYTYTACIRQANVTALAWPTMKYHFGGRAHTRIYTSADGFEHPRGKS